MGRRRRFAVAIAALAAVPLATVIAAFAAGVSIDVSRWRDEAAQRASVAIGRSVILQGALELTLGRELVLRARDVRIPNLPGFAARDLAAIGDVQARVDLFDALRGRARLRGIQASDIGLWLERAADGSGNWSFARQPGPAAPPAVPDLGQIMLNRLAVRYDDARSAMHRFVEVDEFSGSAGPDAALRLALRGRVDARTSYVFRVDGGTLRHLQDGTEPWPFTVDVKTAGAWLHAGGVFEAHRGVARFDFGAGADELAHLGRLLGAPLPPLGTAALYGRVAATARAIDLSHLQGALGGAAFEGQLALDLAGARPRLAGALRMDTLDLRPWVAADVQAQAPPLDNDVSALRNPALRDLVPLDLEVDLSVGRWLGLGVEVRDTSLALHADPRGVHAPLGATVAGHVVSGLLQLDTAAPVPTLALEIGARDLGLGRLSQALWNAPGIDGALKRVGLRVAGRGDTWTTLVRDLEMSLALAGLQVRAGSAAGATPIAFTLDRLDLVAGRGERLRGSARGALQGEPVRLAIRGGTLPDLLGERALPVEFDLEMAPATLRIAAVAGRPESARDASLNFDLRARRAGDLARWLGVAPASDLPLALRGRLRLADDAWQLDAATLKLGRSELAIEARRSRFDGRPFTTASVRSPLLDVPELATLSAGATPKAVPGRGLDAPLLSAAVELADADLDLNLQHVVLARTHLSGVALRARTREGRLLPSALVGEVAGAPFTGQVELDLRAEVPQAKLDLSTSTIDLGVLLRGLGVAEDIDGRVDGLQLALRGHGNSLRELAGNTALEASVVGGSVTVLGEAQRPLAEIRLREAIIGAAAGEPLRLRLDGTLDQTDVRIQASSGSFADFVGDAARLPFAMVARAAGTRLSLDGEVRLPLGREGQLRFEMSGERLDSLNELARVELPPWGPWWLRGPIRMTPTGYALQGLVLDVGRSRLNGSGMLDVGGPRPYLQVQVAAPSIQLDDFPMPPRLADLPERPSQGDGLRGRASQLAGRVDRLLSARFLRRLDADIDVHAKEVLSGADRLGDGELHLKLKEGRLALDPAVVNLPGGSMRLSIAYDLKESEVDFAMAAHVERFDYGIIARRLNRADDLRGLFSLNLELAGTAPSLDSIMRNANGRLDLAVWPTELRSGMFDLWSANLVLTLLPLIDPGVKSQVNCIVGRFDLKHGNLTDDKIMIDTTTVRIRGAGHANLATEELEFVFRPRAKGLGLFRLQTPLRVSGTLTDQRFGFDRRDVFLSVLQVIASPILVPIEWLTVGIAPRDGADLCTDPLRAGGR